MPRRVLKITTDPCGTADRGFTLIELMLVIAIIIILAGMAAGRYEQTVVKAKETKLMSDLAVMRKAIQDYTLDKECGPSSLDDLVTANYLRSIPEDPITQAKDWVTKSDDIAMSPEQTCYGITDLNSASDKTSPFTNTAYSSW
ncbi:MAG: prepilin-type N-terminal cleavage/methylation domain-containing protein [Candidatus Acidiferrales bacterium]